MIKAPNIGGKKLAQVTYHNLNLGKAVEDAVHDETHYLTLIGRKTDNTWVATPVANWKDAPKRELRPFHRCSKTGWIGPRGWM